jgi:hypothetical protein
LLAMQGEFVVVCVVNLRRGGASIAHSSYIVDELILMSWAQLETLVVQ